MIYFDSNTALDYSNYTIDLTKSLADLAGSIDGIARVELALARELLLSGGRAIWIDSHGSVYEIQRDDFDYLWSLTSLTPPRFGGVKFVEDIVLQFRQKKLLRSLRKTKYLPRKKEALCLFGAYWDASRQHIPNQLSKMFDARIFGFVHDLIPISHPELTHSPKYMRRAFPDYLRNMLAVCDRIFVSSDFVAEQLKAFCNRQNYNPPPIHTLPLACDLDLRSDLSKQPLVSRRLTSKKFALMVSTFEPRKNHKFAYELWTELQNRNFNSLIPLVFAGKRGWQTSEIFNRIKSRSRSGNVPFVIVEFPSDDDLAWLYQNARMTLYPSTIEGWGLPISESLSFGTYCLASDAPALKEASQGLAWHESLHKKERWLEEVRRCLSDDSYLAQHSAKIISNFKSRRWSDFTRDLLRGDK